MDISLLGIDPQASIILTFAVIATIKFIDQLFDRDFRGAAKIAGSAVVGICLGFGIDGLTVLSGALGGLAASGLVTTVGYTKKTTPVATIPEPLG